MKLSLSRTGCWLLAIMLLGTGLRLWGIGFGLPYAESRPDELTIITTAIGYGSGDLNPHFFNYPSLFSYVLFACYGLLSVVLLASGALDSIGDIPVYFAENTGVFILIARLISVAAGVATIGVLYCLGWRRLGRQHALLAALFMAVCYLHVRDSHFGVTDIPVTLAVLAVTVFAVRILERGSARDYIAAGLCVGLAASLKYNGALSCVAVLAAHLSFSSFRGIRRIRALLDRRLILAGAVSVGVFAATSPFVFLDWGSFVEDFMFEAQHLAGAGESLASRGWWRHLSVNLRYGTGLPLLVMAVVGAHGLVVKKGDGFASVLLLFPVSYYAMIGEGYTVFARYIVPIVPFVCIVGAYGTIHLCSYIRGAALRRVVLIALIASVTLPNVMRSVSLNIALARDDTRSQMVHYLEKEVPSESEIGWIGTRYGRPVMQASAAALQKQTDLSKDKGEAGRLLKARAAVAREAGFVLDFVSMTAASLRTQVPDHSCIITEYYPTPYSMKMLADAEVLLRNSGYEVAIEFAGADRAALSAEGVIYDFQDSFYVPYSHPWIVTRPGPTLKLWCKQEVVSVRGGDAGGACEAEDRDQKTEVEVRSREAG